MKKNNTFIAEAFKQTSAFGGIAIQLHEDGETVRFQGNNEKVSKWCKVRFNSKNEPYFNANGRRLYFSDFYRIAF